MTYKVTVPKVQRVGGEGRVALLTVLTVLTAAAPELCGEK